MDTRYGIFLRPDPVTCWTVTQVTTALRQQFGLISAGAFPPHATLIGNLATEATVDRLVASLDPVFGGIAPFPVFNSGVRRQGDGYEYDVNLDATGTVPNVALGRIADAVMAAVRPLSVVVDDFATVAVEDYTFAGHLGLASHDLKVENHLADEVGEFIAGLPLGAPASFVAHWYSLIEFRADDWSEQWWRSLSWRHLRSWHAV